MTASSKHNVDLLIRVGVLEKLVDRLMEKVDKILIQAVPTPQSSGSDPEEWEINNATGDLEKKAKAPDELDSLLE